MPEQDLEARCGREPDGRRLHRASGDKVVPRRAIFTGDVFTDASLYSVDGNARSRTVMVVQHPCARRADGVQLASSLLVAEVQERRQKQLEDPQLCSQTRKDMRRQLRSLRLMAEN